jgi:nicotinate-nucleotide pyrophosphorylase (carboxylating)
MISPHSRQKIREMLTDDIGFGDITSEAVVPSKLRARARVITGQSGVLAGVEEAIIAFNEMGATAKAVKCDGQEIRAGDKVMEVEGSALRILSAERTALNLLMRMSGVATATRQMLRLARRANPKIIIAATRKTLLNLFDKRAVMAGGGDPHRFRLDDCILIKLSHLKLTGSIEGTVKLARRVSFSKKVEVEVNAPADAVKAAKAGADLVMFDNMKVPEIKQAIKLLEKNGLRDKIMLEASGGIDPTNVRDYASTGVDIISSGYMTFRAPALDMRLEIQKI